jgi:Holliday junction resolvase RusA-like endonuclease
MTNLINFTLQLEAVSKLRPRVTRNGTFTPEKTKRFELDVKKLARKHMPPIPLTGALFAWVTFYIRRPKSTKNPYPIVRPDLDNTSKAVTDALNKMAYEDDGQIVTLVLSKRYALFEPSILVLIRPLEADDQRYVLPGAL